MDSTLQFWRDGARIQIDGQPTRSCITPVSAAAGKQSQTIEAIGATPAGKRIQRAWLALDVPQCGYCQSVRPRSGMKTASIETHGAVSSSRRNFKLTATAAIGGGLKTLGFGLPVRGEVRDSLTADAPFAPNAFLRIDRAGNRSRS